MNPPIIDALRRQRNDALDIAANLEAHATELQAALAEANKVKDAAIGMLFRFADNNLEIGAAVEADNTLGPLYKMRNTPS